MTQEILDLLNKEYIGKTFIYVSKYGGETEIICDKIDSSVTVKFDKKTELKLKALLDQKSGIAVNKSKEVIENSDKYTASKAKLHITSTKGVVYDYNECYLKH
jgi:hypothetical protein